MDKFKAFLYFTKSERRAVLVLGLAILCIAYWTKDISAVPQPLASNPINYSSESTIDSLSTTAIRLESKNVSIDTVIPKPVSKNKPVRKEPDVRMQASFNPNEDSVEKMKPLPLPGYIKRNIIKYRDAGGVFKCKEDLKKIYGMESAMYVRIEHLLSLPSCGNRTKLLIDVNQASATAFQELRGIGKVLSKRIVTFRDKLGGFHDIAQIAETYGITDSLYQTLIPQLTISKGINPMMINECNLEMLEAHPYVSKKQAKIILAYRKQHKMFNDAAQIRKVKPMDSLFWNRLIPYLDFRLVQQNTLLQTPSSHQSSPESQ